MMKKLILCCIAAISILIPAFGQAPTKVWDSHAGGQYYDQANAVALDKSGNVYVTGYFQREATFGDQRVSSSGDTDIYLAKYTSSGKLLWVRTAGSDYTRPNVVSEAGTALAVTESGDVYMTGSFRQTARFDNVQLTSLGKEDIFIARYTADGDLAWAKRAGGSSQDVVNAAVADDDGNLFITGYFQNDATFDKEQRYASEFTNFYVAKYSASGSLLWLKDGDQTGPSSGKALAYYNGNVIVAGDFHGAIMLGGRRIDADARNRIFLASFSASGKCLQLTQQVSQNYEMVAGLDAGSGGLVLTGTYNDAQGAKRAFVSLFTLGGDLQWIKRSTDGVSGEGRGVRFIGKDRIVVTGNFNDAIRWDDTRIPGNTTGNGFLMTLTTGGSFIWADAYAVAGHYAIQGLACVDEKAVMVGAIYQEQKSPGLQEFQRDAVISSIQIPESMIREGWVAKALSAYPNPNSGQFSVTYRFTAVQARCDVRIMDVVGRQIYVKSLYNVETIDLPVALPEGAKGVYTIQVQAGANEVYKRVIIK